MANIKSAEKRVRVSERRRVRNRMVRGQTRAAVKRLEKALGGAEVDRTEAEALLREAISKLDRAASKGVIHPNAAARKKSRLYKRLNQLQSA